MKLKFVISVLLLSIITNLNAKQTIVFKAVEGDMTPIIRKSLEENADKDVKIIFEKGTYTFLPDFAVNKYCCITNHGNGIKNIIFPMYDYKSVEIEGNGSEFIFHGQEAPFQFINCGKVTISNISIDWDIPYLFEGRVMAVNQSEGWFEVQPETKGHSWALRNGRIEFPDVDGFSYTNLGSTLTFDTIDKKVSYGAWDITSNPRYVEKRAGGALRIYEPIKKMPEVGTILNSKGDREHDRYAPAFEIKQSKNILLDGVIVHHALGMAFLFDRATDIKMDKCGVYLKEGSNRVVSSTADATHFCNCKGDILIENSRFENMLDDGTNVHGTYAEVNKIVDNYTLRLELKHFEQLGLTFAAIGDEIWFIESPDSRRATVNKVVEVKVINERFSELKFKYKLDAKLKPGDVLENKTWNPTFTMKGCTIQHHRARNLMLKTPLKTIIENNTFSSMMSSIMFRGESFFWFESGAVEDVLIRNNKFTQCAFGGSEHAVLNISPRLGKSFNQTQTFDRNIRFENNVIETYDNRIVWADRVNGLKITGNTIKQTYEVKPQYPNAAMIDIVNSKNVVITDNSYIGSPKDFIKTDTVTNSTLKVKNNNGF